MESKLCAEATVTTPLPKLPLDAVGLCGILIPCGQKEMGLMHMQRKLEKHITAGIRL